MRGNPSRIGPWTGGLNLRDKFTEVLPNQISAGYNVYAGPDGVIRKRDPSVVCNNTFTSTVGTDRAWTLTQIPFKSDSAFITTINNKIYWADVSNNTSTDISGAMTFQANRLWSVVQAPVSGGQGPMYAISGAATDTPVYWTGAGNVATWTASAGTLTPGEQMVSFKNRIFMWGGNIGSGYSVRASKVGDPRDWDTSLTSSDSAWETAIDPNENGLIKGIWPFGAYLMVFKQNAIYLVYDLDTGANRLMSKRVGLNSWYSISDTPYGLAFAGNDGHIWITDATKQEKLTDILMVQEGSQSIAAFPATPGFPKVIFSAQVGIYSTAFYEDKLIVSSVGGGTWWYDFSTKAWWSMGNDGYAALAVNKICVSNITSGGGSISTNTSRLYGTWNPNSNQTLAIHCLYVPQFTAGAWKDGILANGTSGTIYFAFFETPSLAPQGKGQELHVRRRYHAMRAYISGTCTVKYTLDSLNAVPTYTTLGAVSAGTGVDGPVQQTFYSLGVGNSIRFRIESTDGNAFAVHPFNLYTQPRLD